MIYRQLHLTRAHPSSDITSSAYDSAGCAAWTLVCRTVRIR